MTDFKTSLEYGKEVEQLLLNHIHKKYPCAVIIPGKFKDYDIWIPELHKSVEVKADRKSISTNNIVIETEMFDKPSGISSTKADFWAIYDGEHFYVTTPDKISNLISKLPLYTFTGSGDAKPKKAYLVNKDVFKSICKSI